MDRRHEIRDFLRARRAALRPEDLGLPRGSRRRVDGLRREEVAMLAGVSADYYNRIERGDLGGVSDQVLASITTALRLDESERAYLRNLVDAERTGPPSGSRTRATTTLRPSVQAMVELMRGTACLVQNSVVDILAVSPLMAELYRGAEPPSPVRAAPSYPRDLFLDPIAPRRVWDWEQRAWETTAMLRYNTGLYPSDRDLRALVAELREHSEAFERLWNSYDVSFHRSGTKLLRHPTAGEIEVDYEAVDLAGDEGLMMFIYSAQPGTPARERLAGLEAGLA